MNHRAIGRAIIALIIGSAWCVPAEAQSIGDAMVTFVDAQLNRRVGGGDSAHLATEALRVGGGEFYPGDLGADSPEDGDRVWGTLVTVLDNSNGTWSDSMPDNACQPGDILQFGGNAVVGTVSYPVNFTAIVKTINTSGRPSAVYQQGLAGIRTVQSTSINVKRLYAGWIRIYRPITRVDVLGTWKFTVVNNAPSDQEFTIMFDITTVSTLTASASNTAGSLFAHKITTDGTVPCVVNNDNTIYVETGKGNEIFIADDGSFGIRQLDQ